MPLRSIITRVLGRGEPTSKKGTRITRRLCVGDVTDNTVWFEACNPDASDFQHQYGIPRDHHTYSDDQFEQINAFDPEDRAVYHVTLEAENDKGTAWLFDGAEEVDELPVGYSKNRLMIHSASAYPCLQARVER